ncbi:Nucleolar protein 12 [Physocladia obscura]|uniref:Nucleolar protein 12 n=1 Tax=Physocladia obscura TaxID=109957 RepID=A0AAD5XDZ2_9FUNG|nr:Nucleolar protein 12 [Physocladia obscura]
MGNKNKSKNKSSRQETSEATLEKTSKTSPATVTAKSLIEPLEPTTAAEQTYKKSRKEEGKGSNPKTPPVALSNATANTAATISTSISLPAPVANLSFFGESGNFAVADDSLNSIFAASKRIVNSPATANPIKTLRIVKEHDAKLKRKNEKKLSVSSSTIQSVSKNATAEEKNDGVNDEDDADDGQNIDANIEVESEDNDQDEVASPHTKKAKIVSDLDDDVEKNKRSVFIGNLPINTASSKPASKKLLTLFKKHGTVESIRFRSIAFANTMPRKVSFIAKEFHSDRDSLNAYIVFKDEESVDKALDLNGKIFQGKHLRVDKAVGDATRDLKKSVFLGNLAFDVSDESIWNAFGECGEVKNVRVIRDRKTNVGKGFGYVQFSDRAIVPIAVKMMSGKEIEGRPVRVTKCSTKSEAPNKLPWQKNTSPTAMAIAAEKKKSAISGASRRVGEKSKRK